MQGVQPARQGFWRHAAAGALISLAATSAGASELTFTNVHDFVGSLEGSGCNGDPVEATPSQLYITCRGGGEHGHGTIAKIGFDGATTVLQTMQKIKNRPFWPEAGLTLGNNGLLYGTTSAGGEFNGGTIFKMTPAGKLTVLRSLAIADGEAPMGRLLLAADGHFYGTTWVAGPKAKSEGVVFRMSASGKYKVLHTFRGKPDDGAQPRAELIQASDGNFYGTTEYGGTKDQGTVFRMTPQGDVTILHSFGLDGVHDGKLPRAGLVEAGDGYLYGASSYAQADEQGVVFRIRPSGEDFTILHTFTGMDGGGPWSPLRLASDGLLYGTTHAGTDNIAGSVYRVTPGSGAVEIVHVLIWPDGVGPKGGLLQASDGALYGTTFGPGSYEGGFSALFKLTGF